MKIKRKLKENWKKIKIEEKTKIEPNWKKKKIGKKIEKKI